MRRRPLQRLLLLVIAVALGVLLGRCFAHRRTQPPPPVAIEDGKTIDFSSGRPVVQDDAAALEQARREMEAATANITFAATKLPEPTPQASPATKPTPSSDPAP